MKTNGKLVLTAEQGQLFSDVFTKSLKEISTLLDSSNKPNARHSIASHMLSAFTRIYAAENGSNRIILSALTYCNIEKSVQRRQYIRATMPNLQMVK